MEFTGNIIELGRRTCGTTADGKTWRVQEYVLETIEHYPQRIVFAVAGEDIGMFSLNVGDCVRASVSFRASKNKKTEMWYNSVRCWKAEKI